MIAGAQPLARTYRSGTLVSRGQRFAWGAKTFVMGVINVTPDSFSGDGTHGDVARAVALARQFEKDGADLLDIGGESSRPGAGPLSPAEECRRVMPALAAIREATHLPISIDTYHAAVAEDALAEGADMVNDIWGLRRDERMARVVARSGAPLIAMHNQRERIFSGDVLGDIAAGFEATLAIAESAGIDRANIIFDPGFGFGWSVPQNLEMLRSLPRLWEFDLPLLLGVSRKSTIGAVTGAAVDERLPGTAAAVTMAIAGGADIVRVHDVRAMVSVTKMADAIVRGWTE